MRRRKKERRAGQGSRWVGDATLDEEKYREPAARGGKVVAFFKAQIPNVNE